MGLDEIEEIEQKMLGEAGTKTKVKSGEVMDHRGHREKHFGYLFVRFVRFARSVPQWLSLLIFQVTYFSQVMRFFSNGS